MHTFRCVVWLKNTIWKINYRFHESFSLVKHHQANRCKLIDSGFRNNESNALFLFRLVQNFLRFPCAFSKSDVGTRCPVLYRLRYNPNLSDGAILIKHPPNIDRPEQLAQHLAGVMLAVERDSGFSSDEYLVHIESNQYRDFEILDVPGLIGGCRDAQREEAVERITENYVRDPKFLIVQLKEASQLPENSFGMKRIRELCRAEPALRGSSFPARPDYENSTITIQTKFDSFINERQHPTVANNDMERLVGYFNENTLFTSMIFEGYDENENIMVI